MAGRLVEKVAIVTGAGFGFGEGITKRFIEEGARVIIVDINIENGERVAAAQPHGTAVFIPGDVSVESDWKKAVNTALSAFGKIDIVVNNAGVVNMAMLSTEVAEQEFDRLFRINTKSLYHSTKAVVPVFRKQGNGGVFVNISSIAAVRPRPNLVWYAASKAAASTVTKGLALELAKDNIRCNAICPSAGETAMVPLVLGKPDTPENRKAMLLGIPLGRLATPEDVANAAVFLASDEAIYITGVELPVDGGRSLS